MNKLRKKSSTRGLLCKKKIARVQISLEHISLDGTPLNVVPPFDYVCRYSILKLEVPTTQVILNA